MDSATRLELVELIRSRGIAALGTLHAGAPLVSMVLYTASPDLSAVFIHVSRLAQHTAGLLRDRRVGLLIAEPDRPTRNPLSTARVSIQADAEPLHVDSPEYSQARSAYVDTHPAAQGDCAIMGNLA
jgi:putative heme iron utilization protein